MKKIIRILLVGISFLHFIQQSIETQAQSRFRTINYLNSITGKYIVSGQHNDQKNGTSENYWTNQVFSITGKYPALYGCDMLFTGSTTDRWAVTYEAERQWNKGAVINVMWHCCPPTQGAVCNWSGGVVSSLTAAQWAELLTNGSNLNITWKTRMDDIATYFQYLKDKGVEMMFRPLHEENQPIFWWNSGTPANTKALYQLSHDYLSNVKGLTNLIWAWDVQDLSSNYIDYNPGSSFFDIATLDIYGNGYADLSFYNALLAQAGNKPVAFGECFNLPSATAIQNQAKMSFFMCWAYGLLKDDNGNPTNSIAYINQVYSNPQVITLDKMPGWNTVPDNLAKNKTVTVSSTEAGENIAAYITDGSYLRRWSSLYADPQWFYVDLLNAYAISEVKITWETAMGKDYQVQVSSDALNWTTIKTVTGNTTLVNDMKGLNGAGRYVRVNCSARATSYGYSVWEMEVYGGLVTGTEKIRTDNANAFYPNPSSGEVFYRLANNGPHHLKIYDAWGQVIFEEDRKTNSPFNTSHFLNGIYLFELIQDGTRIAYRVALETGDR